MVRLLPALAPVEVVAGRLAFALAAAAPALAVPRARAEVWQATRGAAAWTLAALMGSYYLLAVGLFFGAYGGAKLNQVLSPVQAKRAFAVFLMVIAVRLWITARPR